MKKIRVLSLFLTLLMLLSALTACRPSPNPDPTPTPTPTPTPAPIYTTTILENGVCNYTVVRPTDCDSETNAAAMQLRAALATMTEKGYIPMDEDFIAPTHQPKELEILVGSTNRDESTEVLSGLKYQDYKITVVGKKVVIAAHSPQAITAAVTYFIENYIGDKKDNKNATLSLSSENAYTYQGTYELNDVKIGDTPLEEYQFVLPASRTYALNRSYQYFLSEVRQKTGIYLKTVEDTQEASEHEILFGNTNRAESKKYYDAGMADNTYAFELAGQKLVIAASLDYFAFKKATEDFIAMLTAKNLSNKQLTIDVSKPILTSFGMSDIHNNFAMLEPPYVFRKNAAAAVDQILSTRGQVDVLMIGGDFMSDYPSWNSSGHLPYAYFVGFRDHASEILSKLAKDGKVMYIAGNHDYAQGEKSTDGPGKNGSYNSADFYYNGPMKDTLGELPESEKFEIVGTHTGEKYLLAYHYEVNGVHFIGFSPDPDKIWSEQGYGFNTESLKWLDNKLKEIDPNGDAVIFMNCHYDVAYRQNGELYSVGSASNDLVPILKSHKNLFYLFGHIHHADGRDYAKKKTAEVVVHYSASGTAVNTSPEATSYANSVSRGFTAVYMGAYRIDYQADRFGLDKVYGYGGYSYKQSFPSTATPKLSQGLYIAVYEDRVEFQCVNTGTLNGFKTSDIIEPYTVYLYK